MPRAAAAGLTLLRAGGRLGRASWALARDESAGWSAALLTFGQPHCVWGFTESGGRSAAQL